MASEDNEGHYFIENSVQVCTACMAIPDGQLSAVHCGTLDKDMKVIGIMQIDNVQEVFTIGYLFLYKGKHEYLDNMKKWNRKFYKVTNKIITERCFTDNM